MNRTGRGCLADLKLGFFCVKEVKPLEFLWFGAAVGWWQALVGDSCSPGTHSAAVLVTEVAVLSRNPNVHPAGCTPCKSLSWM